VQADHQRLLRERKRSFVSVANRFINKTTDRQSRDAKKITKRNPASESANTSAYNVTRYMYVHVPAG